MAMARASTVAMAELGVRALVESRESREEPEGVEGGEREWDSGQRELGRVEGQEARVVHGGGMANAWMARGHFPEYVASNEVASVGCVFGPAMGRIGP